ncbi:MULTISPECIES: DUF1128 domain-containing protein [unclassified Virgibacillus]|uniref:DUF1128 domain-containing protein n=1 Tax=unclassified Virgibacillus TaxID=2620237 RepID=UPI0024DE1DBF|nr:DUF1128 domain-containing protein [Virgibacillus sp. LDC-1]
MNLNVPTKENMQIILDEIAEKLSVVNRSIMDAADYDLEKYEELKQMHALVLQKGSLSAFEVQAFLDELRTVRKS